MGCEMMLTIHASAVQRYTCEGLRLIVSSQESDVGEGERLTL